MKFLIVLMVVLGINSARGQAIVDKLVSKPWEGSGVLMGSPADFKMNWEWTLNKQFLRLTFQNKRKAENGNEQIFMAEAFYKPVNDSLVKGTWFDSRGLSFPLSGTIEDRKLTVLWGSPETEEGKTIYTLDGTENISVSDYILKEGKYMKFGEAGYEK